MPLPFADRLNNVETSAIRELFKLLGKPGIISFAGGFPDPALLDATGIAQASAAPAVPETRIFLNDVKPVIVYVPPLVPPPAQDPNIK